MKQNTFFEGADFGEGVFKALMPEYYTAAYQQYIEEERTMLCERVKGAERILEAGVGTGRLIPDLAPLVDEFIGVDNADLMVALSNKKAETYPHASIQKANLENVSELYDRDYFDYSLCVWNTLGNVKDEEEVLRALAAVTKNSIFVTVFLKGTNEERKALYANIEVDIERVDEEHGIFYTTSGLRSKSYSREDLQSFADHIGLTVSERSILGGVMLYARLDT